MRTLLVICALSAPAAAQENQPHVDLVIALDVSGSMRGLIDATRVKLWDVVRLLGRAQPQPRVRVGLITFGGKYHDAAAGWVRRELDLTTDLDAVSARLFALQARGSQEYVARTVQTAAREMSWDQDPKALKILFVAGNESAEQDPRVTLASALAEARQRGLFVNTIYCGRPDEHDAMEWRRVAALGAGEFASIDHRQSAVARITPYDAELGRLSLELSHTYVGYGDGAGVRRANQAAEDKRAAADGPQVAAARAAAKATRAYDNSDWDVVDAYARHHSVEKLPPEMAAMSDSERAGFVRNKLAAREALQQRIRDLSGKRDAFLSVTSSPAGATVTRSGTTTPIATGSAPQPPAPATPPAKSASRPMSKPAGGMDDAFVGTVRKQAEANGYGF
jgi:von Willebrand factor type A domain